MRGEAALQRVPIAFDQPAVVACAVTPLQRSRLIDALRGRVSLTFCATFAELSAALEHPNAIDAIVLPACASSGGAANAIRMVREIAESRPRTAIVVWCDAVSHHSVEIRALAVAGAHQFLFAGIDDDGVALRAVLDLARRQCGAEWLMTQLAPVVPGQLYPMLEALLARPDSIKTLDDLAAALGVHRKTLFNHCRRARFLAPAELIAWVRLAMVAYMLETTGCTIERIGIELGYASDTALRNTIKRYTGLRAGQIRDAGAVQQVIRALEERARHAAGPPTLRLL